MINYDTYFDTNLTTTVGMDDVNVTDDMAFHSLYQGKPWVFKGTDYDWQPELDNSGNPTGNMKLSNLEWFGPANEYPKQADVEAERVRLQALADAAKYKRQRVREYPSWEMLADAIYHQANGDDTKMNAYVAAISAIKQKYPKE
jgi:hypothetical protein